MFATSNCPPMVLRSLSRLLPMFAGVGLVFVQGCLAQTNSAAEAKAFVAYAEKTLVAARARYHREPTNAKSAWQFGKACFDRGEFAVNDTERATLAVEGIDAMRQLVAREPKLAAAHYYLAMNLGQFARTKLLGALKIVDEMEEEFKAARELDEQFDFAGPDRNLGQLYFQAPGWPASIGSRSKARKHLERAAVVSPGFPDNQLFLLEACCDWRDTKGIRHGLKAVEEIWPMAKANFTGEAWAASWPSWEKQRRELSAAAHEILRK